MDILILVLSNFFSRDYKIILHVQYMYKSDY